MVIDRQRIHSAADAEEGRQEGRGNTVRLQRRAAEGRLMHERHTGRLLSAVGHLQLLLLLARDAGVVASPSKSVRIVASLVQEAALQWLMIVPLFLLQLCHHSLRSFLRCFRRVTQEGEIGRATQPTQTQAAETPPESPNCRRRC